MDSLKQKNFYGTITDGESKLQILIKNSNETELGKFTEGKKVEITGYIEIKGIKLSNLAYYLNRSKIYYKDV